MARVQPAAGPVCYELLRLHLIKGGRGGRVELRAGGSRVGVYSCVWDPPATSCSVST